MKIINSRKVDKTNGVELLTQSLLYPKMALITGAYMSEPNTDGNFSKHSNVPAYALIELEWQL